MELNIMVDDVTVPVGIMIVFIMCTIDTNARVCALSCSLCVYSRANVSEPRSRIQQEEFTVFRKTCW